MPWKQTIKMLRYFTLLFIFGCVSKVLCLQSSCSAEPPGPERAAGCGCDKLTRDAPTVDPLDEDEGKAASTDPDLKYSKDANDRTNQVQDNERETQSPVCCDSRYRKKKKKTPLFCESVEIRLCVQNVIKLLPKSNLIVLGTIRPPEVPMHKQGLVANQLQHRSVD